MEIKKNPKANLENYSKLFMQLGLVLALFITYVAIEKKTYDRQFGDLGDVSMNDEMEEEPPITERIEPEIPKTPPPPTPEKIEVVDDEEEVEETIIESTETDENEAVEVEEIEEVEEVEEVIEDVPFTIIEDVPVFPGCKGNKTELKACFNKKMQKHFQKKFSKYPPPGVIVEVVQSSNFFESIETFGTALSKKNKNFRVKKSEILDEKIRIGKEFNEGEVLLRTKNKIIIDIFKCSSST